MFAGTFFLGGECSYSPVCGGTFGTIGIIGVTGITRQISAADIANIKEACQ